MCTNLTLSPDTLPLPCSMHWGCAADRFHILLSSKGVNRLADLVRTQRSASATAPFGLKKCD
ncbi:MAG: hypothetical protein J6D26_00205, partial [Clostridia bacterium]|nr:hypothetical protein [Clostridia bacterium]